MVFADTRSALAKRGTFFLARRRSPPKRSANKSTRRDARAGNIRFVKVNGRATPPLGTVRHPFVPLPFPLTDCRIPRHAGHEAWRIATMGNMHRGQFAMWA